MRCLALVGMIAMAILWRPPAAAATDIPPGSYQKSCRDITMKGVTLYATCQNSSGQWQKTSLSDAGGCKGDIRNLDGQLVCAARSPEGQLYPDHAQVRPGPEKLPEARQTRTVGSSGSLRGSYVQTCRDVRTQSDKLMAVCQTIDGRWVSTTLDAYSRCTGDIVNDDGRLECTRSGGKQVPTGPYSQTCRQIYVRGDTLRAQCQNRAGQWVWTQLNDWDSCRSAIVNLDGVLHCDR